MAEKDRKLEDLFFSYVRALGFAMLILSAILAIYLLIKFLNPDQSFTATRIARIQAFQLRFFIVGISAIFLAALFKRLRIFELLSRREIFVNLMIVLTSLGIFIFTLNNLLGIKYCAEPVAEETEIFVKDERLGWKLKPNAEGRWQKGIYKINSKGLRCRHSEYEKPVSVKRILQLGDSVTAGFGLSYEETYPFLLENLLNQEAGKVRFEVINAACDGYAPWQEYEFLKTEGMKYGPDMVTLGFVPNDVTEPLCLKRFGGHDIGHQLSRTRNSGAGSFYAALTRMPIYLS